MKILISESQLNIILKKIINEDVFVYDELNDQEKNDTYDIFKKSYEKTTGKSWDRSKFDSRAQNWVFYGIKSKGFVVVRKQKSGMNKITGVAGDIRSISIGINEINNLNEPVWGLADKKLVDILTKKYNFYSPPGFIVKLLIKQIPPSVFGGVNYIINKDGSLTLNYSDVGDATKYFFGNKKYFQQILKQSNFGTLVNMAINKFLK